MAAAAQEFLDVTMVAEATVRATNQMLMHAAAEVEEAVRWEFLHERMTREAAEVAACAENKNPIHVAEVVGEAVRQECSSFLPALVLQGAVVTGLEGQKAKHVVGQMGEMVKVVPLFLAVVLERGMATGLEGQEARRVVG